MSSGLYASPATSGKDTAPQRVEFAFARLRAEGVSRKDAGKAVGVDKRSAQDWDKGISQFSSGGLYPDGRVVRYGEAAILANVKKPRHVYTGRVPADLARLVRPVDARFFSLIEQEQRLMNLGARMPEVVLQ